MNTQEIRRTLEIFKNYNDLVEVRIIGDKSYSGYFKDPDTLIKAIEPFENSNIYFVFNSINDACYSKTQRDKIIAGKDSTKDTDIIASDRILRQPGSTLVSCTTSLRDK